MDAGGDSQFATPSPSETSAADTFNSPSTDNHAGSIMLTRMRRKHCYGAQELRALAPGRAVGMVDLAQHEAAARAAVNDRAIPNVELDFSSHEALQRNVEEHIAETKGGREALPMLMALNMALEAHGATCAVTTDTIGVVQKVITGRLAKMVPLKKGDKGAQAQLRQRLSVARGSVPVRYTDADGATQLLAMLASQNTPGIKAVLRLSKAGEDWRPCTHKTAPDAAELAPAPGGKNGYVLPATAADPHTVFKPLRNGECGAEFEINMDVRGILVDPKEAPVTVLSSDSSVGACIRQVAKSLLTLYRQWDTVAFIVPLAGTAAAVALEICFKAMNLLSRDARGGAAIVEWHHDAPGDGKGGANLDGAHVLITLAETHTAHCHMVLLNSPAVVRLARSREDQSAPSVQKQLEERFAALMTSSEAMLTNTMFERAQVDVLRGSVARPEPAVSSESQSSAVHGVGSSWEMAGELLSGP